MERFNLVGVHLGKGGNTWARGKFELQKPMYVYVLPAFRAQTSEHNVRFSSSGLGCLYQDTAVAAEVITLSANIPTRLMDCRICLFGRV